MRMHLFWEMIKEVNQKADLQLNDQILVWATGDVMAVSQSTSSLVEFVSTEEIIYAADKEDPDIGSVLFVKSSTFTDKVASERKSLHIDGSVSVVSANRYLETIETMKKLVDGELFLEEVLTSSVEWKRELFKYIYSKYESKA